MSFRVREQSLHRGVALRGQLLRVDGAGLPGVFVKMHVLIQKAWAGALSLCISGTLPGDSAAASPQTTLRLAEP